MRKKTFREMGMGAAPARAGSRGKAIRPAAYPLERGEGGVSRPQPVADAEDEPATEAAEPEENTEKAFLPVNIPSSAIVSPGKV